ncbi:MAG: hypothetical protein ACOC80_16045 [Petrotogales bacterium]
MKKNTIRTLTGVLVIIFLFASSATAFQGNTQRSVKYESLADEDLDELTDVTVTVKIDEIRTLEKRDIGLFPVDKIDRFSDPDFYVKVFINDVEFKSDVWYNTKYVYGPWEATLNVPDDQEFVNIKIQLWDWNIGLDKICDISGDHTGFLDSYDIELVYSIKTGHWWGDDFAFYESTMSDPSGYGRLNGCDDNSIYQNDRDCEILFSIYQNDYDNDGIPYWTEVNVYGTDPKVDNRGEDADADGIPIEWEHKWGHYYSEWHDEHWWEYDPFEFNDHANLDPDKDGLDNIEEYLTFQWGSDPFRQDIFLELDQMEIGPNGEGGFVPDLSKDLLRVAYAKHNIVFHIDDGCMGGGEKDIEFDPATTNEELQQIYTDYFIHNDQNNWRRGVFHYALIVFNSTRHSGFVFRTYVNNTYLLDSFVLATAIHEVGPLYNTPILNILRRKSLNKEYHRAIDYAGVMMHETGHTLGIFSWNTPGCDNPRSVFPRSEWLKYRGYRSCMNYNYVYYMVDYSDGSRGKNDFDDWKRIDLTLFQREGW